MKMNLPKVNWEKAGAYAFGGLLGGGLTALAWHVMEGRGINPGMIFRKKIRQGNISYYDPEKDPNLDDLMSDIEETEMDDLDVLAEDDEDEEEDVPPDSDGINEPRIYRIDAETWYRSEDEMGYKHGEMKYWIDDQQCTDENDVRIPKPWLLIGEDNYDALADENADREMYVRNEDLETDYLVVRTEGSLD